MCFNYWTAVALQVVRPEDSKLRIPEWCLGLSPLRHNGTMHDLWNNRVLDRPRPLTMFGFEIQTWEAGCSVFQLDT